MTEATYQQELVQLERMKKRTLELITQRILERKALPGSPGQ